MYMLFLLYRSGLFRNWEADARNMVAPKSVRWGAHPPRRAVTIYPRYADLIVAQIKRRENRSEKEAKLFKKLGWLLVHAKSTATPPEHEHRINTTLSNTYSNLFPEDPEIYGHIIGAMHVAAIQDAATASEEVQQAPWVIGDGKWSSLCIIDKAVKFKERYKAKGQMGAWSAETRMAAADFARMQEELDELEPSLDDSDDEDQFIAWLKPEYELDGIHK